MTTELSSIDDLLAFFERICINNGDAGLVFWLNGELDSFEHEYMAENVREDIESKRQTFGNLCKISACVNKVQTASSEERFECAKQSAAEVYSNCLGTLMMFTQRWTSDFMEANWSGNEYKRMCKLTLNVMEVCEMIGEFCALWMKITNSVE